MEKTSAITVRVDQALRAAIDKAAAADTRSMSSLIEKILKDALKKTGYLK